MSNKAGQVIKRLNKIISTLLDRGTQNSMIVEHWGSEVHGELEVMV